MEKILEKLKLRERFKKIGNLFSFVTILILTLGIFATVQLAQNQNTGKIQTKAGATKVSLSIYPTSETFLKDEVKFFQVMATFTDGSANQKIDYLKTEILFNKNYLQMPTDKYIEATTSGFNRVFRIDGPTVVNGSGKMVIELGADSPDSGPTTDKPITLAKFYLAGKSETSASQRISFGKIQVVSSQTVISVDDVQNTKGVTYTVSTLQAPTSTPTPKPKLLWVDIFPEEVRTSVGGPAVNLSSLAYGEDKKPIWSEITYEWGISSASSVGSVSPLYNNVASFYPNTPGIGNLFVIARQGDTSVVAGIPIIVVSPTPSPTPTRINTPTPTVIVATATIMPTPTTTPFCNTKLKGDADCDGKVDGVDYSIWLNSQCHPPVNQKCLDVRADFNQDGNVDDDDYDIWLNNREN